MIQPTLNGFMGRYRAETIPGLSPSKENDPKLRRGGVAPGARTGLFSDLQSSRAPMGGFFRGGWG